MAMLEKWTVPLERPKLDRIIEAARVRKGFRVLKKELTVATLHGSPIPRLDCFELSSIDSINLSWDGPVDNESRLLEFIRVKEALRGRVAICTARVEIDESGSKPVFDHFDTWLRFGDDFFGPFMSISLGAASRGCKDLAYRSRLFQKFLEAIGAAGRVDVIALPDGGLDLKVSVTDVAEFDNVSREEAVRLLRAGGLVLRRAGCHPGKLNPSEIHVWDGRRDLLTAASAALKTLGVHSVVDGDVRVSCKREEYEGVGNILAISQFAPWQASFMGRSRYDLDTLNDLISEMDSFVLLAFTLKERGVGKVYAEICSDRGQMKMHFYANPQRGPQDERLNELIAVLAGGEDVLDMEHE